MHKVDIYLLKNTCYFFILANIIPLIFTRAGLALWTNGVALLLSLLMLMLIRLTVRRYAGDFGKSPAEVKQLLAEYIEDKRRGKLTFHDYVKKCKKAQDAAVAAPTNDN